MNSGMAQLDWAIIADCLLGADYRVMSAVVLVTSVVLYLIFR